MHYVYILQSLKDESYYTGFTTDVEARLKKHNSGAVEYTSTKRPFKLVWYCCFEDKVKALQFEKYLKSGSGFVLARKKTSLISLFPLPQACLESLSELGPFIAKIGRFFSYIMLSI